jgi:hypothetical protein
MSEGTKYDGGKDRWDLLPWQPVRQIVKVLTFGALKYDGWNWSKGIKYSRVRAALQRHLSEWDERRNHDKETGLHHLAHAGCCLLFLLFYELYPSLYETFDDRPSFPGGGYAQTMLEYQPVPKETDQEGWDKE